MTKVKRYSVIEGDDGKKDEMDVQIFGGNDEAVPEGCSNAMR